MSKPQLTKLGLTKAVGFVLLTGLLLTVCAELRGQANWPGLSDQRLNNTLHDLGHAGAAVIVIGGTGWATDWPLETRMALGTVVWPLANTAYDLARWCNGDFGCMNWGNEVEDFLSHQLPWAGWFAKQGKWLSAVYTVALYSGWLYWRYWSEPAMPIRDSFWWHGAVVGGYMAGLALVLDVNPRASYVQANAVLVFREVLQLATGQGEWTDLASGLLLPLPYLFER
jgi:hypothetical protein